MSGNTGSKDRRKKGGVAPANGGWNDVANIPITRRKAISSMGKAAVGAAAAVIVVGGAAYYLGASGSKTTTVTGTGTTSASTSTNISSFSTLQQLSLLVQSEPLENAELAIDAADMASAIGVSVSPTELNFTQMAPTLTAMTAGNNITYNVVSIAHDQAGPYVPYFRSLDDLIQKYNADLSVFTPALVNQLYKRDKTTGRFGTGNHLGIPYISAPWGLQYNTKMFTDAGLVDSKGNPTLPNTWDNFVEYMTELTKPPVYGLGASYSVWWNPAWMHVSYVSTNGGHVLDPNTYEPLINDSTNVEALQFWADAVNVHKYAQPDALTTDDATLEGLFNAGSCASYIYWFTGTLPSANDPSQSNVAGYAAAAALPNGGTVPAGGWAHWMPQTETNPDASFAYMMYESTNEVAAALVSGDLSLVRTASFSDPQLVAKYPYITEVGQIAAKGYAEPSFDIQQGSQLWTIYLQGFQNVISGSQSAQAALDSVYDQWDAILGPKGAGYYGSTTSSSS
ncbi:MAG: hypothetical protein OK474_04070 [Thaumarchaeota archaeon]|nr:hypothetical protein [Nitrososphaerota archaeon]